MSVRTFPSPGSRMRVAMSVAIAVATHPAAGVDRRCVHPLVGGVDEASAGCAGASSSVAGSCSGSLLAISSPVASCSRRFSVLSIVSLCAFAVSIASESSGRVALKGMRRTFARNRRENVQGAHLENYSLLHL